MSRDASRGGRTFDGLFAPKTAPAKGLMTARAGLGGCSDRWRSAPDHRAGLGYNAEASSGVAAASRAAFAWSTSVSMLYYGQKQSERKARIGDVDPD